MYANLTDKQRQEILKYYDYSMSHNCNDVNHAIASSAHRILCESNSRKWNGKYGGNAYAAACAVVIMAGKVTLIPK